MVRIHFLQNNLNENPKSDKCVLWLRSLLKNSKWCIHQFCLPVCLESFDAFILHRITPVSAPIASFQASDVEKTVVIPGYSSFLITSIVDNMNALAIATMPGSVPDNKTFVNGSWFLYNFGQRNGRTWAIYAKPCNYWFQQRDSSLSLNVLKYIDLGKSQVLKVKVIPNTKGKLIFIGKHQKEMIWLSLNVNYTLWYFLYLWFP